VVWDERIASIRADLATMNEKDFWRIVVRSVNFNFLDEQRKEKLDEFFVRAALR
jgi:hypothetical protein